MTQSSDQNLQLTTEQLKIVTRYIQLHSQSSLSLTEAEEMDGLLAQLEQDGKADLVSDEAIAVLAQQGRIQRTAYD